MKRLIIIFLCLLPFAVAFAQQEKSFVKKGNEHYQEKKFDEAEADYRKAVEKAPENPKTQHLEGNFNLGDALYKQKKFADASEQFNKIAEASNKNKAITAGAYHNLGNSYLQNKNWRKALRPTRNRC